MQEIENFKVDFRDNGTDGTGTLFRVSAEEWLEHIRKMENTDDHNSVPCLQY